MRLKATQKVYMSCPYCAELAAEGVISFVPQIEASIVDFLSKGQLTCHNCGNVIVVAEALDKDAISVRTAKGEPIEVTEPLVTSVRSVDPDLEELDD